MQTTTIIHVFALSKVSEVTQAIRSLSGRDLDPNFLLETIGQNRPVSLDTSISFCSSETAAISWYNVSQDRPRSPYWLGW